MKKILLLLLPVLIATGYVNAQLQGYSWYFNSAPFNSTPAVNTSAGSYTLTEVGSGAPMTVPVSQSVGLGTSCTGPINVGSYTKPYGLVFSNSPQLVTGSYSVEMVVNLASLTNGVRLLGFSTGDDGVYVTATGSNVTFYDGTTDHLITTTLTAATWYDIVITRNGVSKDMTLYINGAQVGTPYNDAADVFIPQVANSNLITFFKDNQDNIEEASGMVAKLSVYNDTLSPTKVDSLFNNVCNSSFQFLAPNLSPQGYQWTFGTGPYTSLPSIAADAASAGSYPLDSIGSGSITTASSAVGLGAGCSGAINVGQFVKPIGYVLANNAPQYVGGTYTVEMVVNFTSLAGAVRLFGFDGSDDGVYIDAGGGAINLYTAPTPHYFSPIVLTANTWYQVIVTRDGTTKDMNVYVNNVQIGGTFNDAGDVFVPKETSSYNMTFLKDNTTEESDGMIAKAAVFNKVLSTAQIQERFDNICNTNLIVLPVSLKNFTAQKVGKKVELSWTTSSELNNLGFEVQRSTNGVNFTAIGFVKGAGNSNTNISYQFTDAAPVNGKGYYRLKQLSIDNRFKLSAVRWVDFAKDIQDLQIYPNPVRSILTIVNLKAGNTLNVYDGFGRFVMSKKATDTEETLSVQHLSAGVYVLQVVDSNGNKRTIRFTRL